MKAALACVAALLWQAGNFGGTRITVAPLAEPQHLRYERALKLPNGASGTACAILDANVFAHSASASLGDLRVFQSVSPKGQREIPFAVSFSAAQPTDATTATVGNVTLRNNLLHFDLAMPQRSYTTVELKLAAENFIGTADVSGSDGKSRPSKPLGSFEVFDLTRQHLARSTSLPLQESSFAELHVRLRLRSIDGGALPGVSTAMVEGAMVPASREAQTLYTVVATGGSVSQQNGTTVIKILAPAHVPLEQVRFRLNAAFKDDFLRDVSISATSDRQTFDAPEEHIDGQIWRVTRDDEATGILGIHAEKLTMTAVLASNLRDAATVTVAVKNGGETPLPIQAVELEMRQRTLCFNAAAGAAYTLRYGDDALLPSVYNLDGLRMMPAVPIVVTLGREELNRSYVGRHQISTYTERNPEVYWLVLLGVIAAFGALGARHTRHRGRHR